MEQASRRNYSRGLCPTPCYFGERVEDSYFIRGLGDSEFLFLVVEMIRNEKIVSPLDRNPAGARILRLLGMISRCLEYSARL